MNLRELTDRRLHSQGISSPARRSVAATVGRMGAIQAQDFSLAKWGIGLRSTGIEEPAVDRAFDRGEIVRTHVLRPTWHFVAAADLRWLLALTAPRVHVVNQSTYTKVELDGATFRRSNRALIAALGEHQHLTRDQLRPILAKAKIDSADNLRMTCLMMFAELEGVVTSGPRQGKQFTYALVDRRVPPTAFIDRGESLTRLAKCFFETRGPATVHDFAKWSGLTIAESRAGVEAVQAQFGAWDIDGRAYHGPKRRPPSGAPAAHLLSVYDEYLSGYRDRAAIVTPRIGRRLVAMGNDLTGVVVLDGALVGSWKRLVGQDTVAITVSLMVRPTPAARRAIAAAADRFGQFIGKAATVTVRAPRT